MEVNKLLLNGRSAIQVFNENGSIILNRLEVVLLKEKLSDFLKVRKRKKIWVINKERKTKAYFMGYPGEINYLSWRQVIRLRKKLTGQCYVCFGCNKLGDSYGDQPCIVMAHYIDHHYYACSVEVKPIEEWMPIENDFYTNRS